MPRSHRNVTIGAFSVGHQQHLFDSFQKGLDAFARELPGVEQGNVEALHRTRVASRRLRELLPLLPLDRATTKKLNRRLRRVTKQLGIVRELDVLVELIDQLHCSGRFSPIALTKMSDALGRARDAARKRLVAKLRARKLQRLANTLQRVTKSCESAQPQQSDAGPGRTNRRWSWALDARLAHRASRVRTAIERAGALYAPEPLHDVRIALKKLRYIAEPSLEAGRPRLAADVAALKAAQDLLGRLHDCEVLIAWGRDAQASLSTPDFITWRELRLFVHTIENDCREMHARYMRDRARLIAIANHVGGGQALPSVVRHRAAG